MPESSVFANVFPEKLLKILHFSNFINNIFHFIIFDRNQESR
ncbi:Uncharacterized protein dnl_20750 [Desulfonema limicola]|uniref:Uncharacterized protein n=1 Tax=Desulfonema limicola TaxID=45656 RepID=A0A975B6M4_9BACT|nr:Uncharacterized protein dnl_20750 [Desulfonema limicola]